MSIAMFKQTDYTHSDPEKDRRGVHKKTDYINWKPDDFLDFAHGNGPGSYLEDFCFIKIPDMPLAEAEANDYRKPWRDDFDYEIVASRPAQGEYDVRVFEKNSGATNQNAIAGVKATKVRNYLQAWGCSGFSMSATDATFTFSLWDAVRSVNFWEVSALALAQFSFVLNSYSGQSGVGNITVSWLSSEELKMRFVRNQIEGKGGVIISYVEGENTGDPVSYTFEIERSDIMTRFRQDVKRRVEQTYMRHQYGISQADHDAIIAAGGVVTMTKAEFLSKLINKMAAI